MLVSKNDMKVTIKTYWGPNRYSTRPCVIFCFEEIEEEKISTMRRSCVDAANYLKRNFGYPHALERRISIDNNDVFDFLSSAAIFILNYVRGELDESGYVPDSTVPTVFVEFHKPELTVKALNILLNLLFRISVARDNEFNAILNSFWNECQKGHPDFQAHALITAAKTKRIHYANLDKKIWLYGMGSKSKIFFETSTIEDLQNGIKADKLSGKQLFSTVGAPTACYRVVKDRAELLTAISDIGFPCAIKPVYSGSGKGVTANIKTFGEVEFAYAEAIKFSGKNNEIMVEEYVPGRDYRLLFIRGDFIGCASSVAPFVIGDGVKSVRELIDSINIKRTRNLYESKYLRPIKVDASVIETLSVQGLGLNTILQPGQKVKLRRNTNLGGGGFTETFENVHHEVLAIAKKIAGHSGLHSVGIDYITQDITTSPSVSGGKFTELNKVPGVPLFLAAGYDIAKLGAHFLGKNIGSIVVNLFILQNDHFQEFLQSYSGKYALFLPNIVVKKGKTSKFENSHFKQIIGNVFSDKELNSLDIVARLEFVEEFGFPTEHVTKVFVGESCKTKTVYETIEKLHCHVQYV